MRGIDTGTVLADRYVLEELLAQRDETLDYWSATDRTLDRLVAVTVLPASGQFEEMAHAVLDGARRTAGVDDPRLVRVLDVGLDEGFCWIVEEGLSEAESLASLVSQHPLPAEEARRIVGEAASGLESARRRGLHHLYLNPHAVLRTSEGSVKVSGIGVAAAIEQVDDVTADEATLIDTGDLLSLLYTGLTGRWPGEQIEGLRGARRLAGGSLPAPSEVVSGVPGDLDALCRMTFGAEHSADQGPRTPGELARQLAPWPSEMVAGTGGQAFGPDSPLAGLGADASLAGAAGAGAAITTTSLAQDDAAASDSGLATGAGDDTGWSGQDHWQTDSEAARASGPVEAEHTTVVEPAYYRTEAGTPSSQGGTSTTGSGAASGPDADFDDRSPSALAGAGLSGATADRTSERRQSGVVLALIAAILVVAVFLAYGAFQGLLPGNDGPTEAATGASAAPSTDDAAQTSAGAGGDTSEQTQAEPSRDDPLEPIEPAGITSYDPEGDGDERNDLVNLAIDDNVETAWNSHTYLAADWGNLKSGVGLLVDLEESQEVSEVDLDFPQGDYAVEVYLTDEATREGATSIGARDDASGEVTFTADEPATGRYVLIWFSRAWDGPDGEIVYLSEVAVK